MTTNFEALLHVLSEANIRFVIVGGFAAFAHGSSTMTYDLDVCIDLAPDNLLALGKSLSALHPAHRFTPAQIPLDIPQLLVTGIKNLYLKTDLGVLDCLGEVLGLGSYPEVLQVSEEIELFGKRIRLLTLDGIIQAKEAMNRPKDIQTSKELRYLRLQRAKGGQGTETK